MKIVRIAAIILMSSVLAACGLQAQAIGTPAPRPGQAFNLTTDDVIAKDQRLVRANPNNWTASDELAAAYLQKVREVGDPAYYPKVAALLEAALRHDPAAAAWRSFAPVALSTNTPGTGRIVPS